MKGLLVRMSWQKADSMLRSGSMAAIADVNAAPGDVLIGAVQEPSSETWRVTLTARVSKVKKQTPQWGLSCVKKWEKAGSWELPRGVVPSAPPAGVLLAELSAETVRACVADLSPLAAAAKALKTRPLGFRLDGRLADEMVVIFSEGEPELWLGSRWEDEVAKRPDGYRRVLAEFLCRAVPSQKKGSLFEDILKELFRAVERADPQPRHITHRTQRSRDRGVDLVITRSSALVGQDKVFVQAKNTLDPVGAAAVQALRGVCSTDGATHGVLVSVGGFSTDARQAAMKGTPPIYLVPLDELCAAVWENLWRMEQTQKWFRDWCQGRLPL